MSIVIADRATYVKACDIEDGKAYKNSEGTIFIGCEILAVSPEQTDEVLPPLIVKAVSLDGSEFITEDQDVLVRAITIQVEQVQEGHLQ